MPITNEQLNSLKSTLTSTLKPALILAGASNPASAAILFGVDMVFRFVTLGSQIRAAIGTAQVNLDQSVRREGIFRVPIQVDMEFSVLKSFFTQGDCQLVYPRAYQQLNPEIEIIGETSHPQWQDAFDTLRVAYQMLPEIYFDLKFNSEFLDNLFGRWLDAGNINFRELFIEMKPFVLPEATSLNDLERLLPAYSKLKLELMGVQLANLTQSALDALNKSIRDLVWGAILGNTGMVNAATAFAKNQKMELIDEDTAKLNARKAVLEAIPEATRTNSEKSELQQVKKRLEELSKLKERIKAA